MFGVGGGSEFHWNHNSEEIRAKEEELPLLDGSFQSKLEQMRIAILSCLTGA
jgi:hypothetical protein